MWDAAAGADLRKYRTEILKWPQGRLAEELGCDQSTVSRIEAGDPPSKPIFHLINILRERLPAEAAQ